jgi:hypothetical protein
MSDERPPLTRPASRNGAMLRRLVPMLVMLVLAVLAIAWVDGGERALRPITEVVELPSAQPAPVPELVPVGGEG